MDVKMYPGIKNSILLCLLLLGLQLGFGIITGILRMIFNVLDASVFTGISTGLGSLIPFGVVLLIGFKKTKRSFNEIFKFNGVSPLLWIAAIVFTIGFVIVISEIDNLLNYILPMPEMLRAIFDELTAGQPFVSTIIVIGIIPAITEELFFRGLILDGLNRNYTKRKAAIISALLFGIIHLNPWQFLSGFIIGLISAWICIHTHSILLSIYIHFFNNTLYAITAKYRDLFLIKGFNDGFAAPGEFQPLWLDAAGIAVLIAGIILFKKGLAKEKNGS